MAARLALAALTACLLASPASDRVRAELKGPVRMVVTHREIATTQGPTLLVLGSETYNAAGALIEEVEFMADFTRTRRPERIDTRTVRLTSVMGDSVQTVKLGAKGEVLEEQTRHRGDPGGPPDEVFRFKYDAAGRVVERAFFGPDGKRYETSVFTRNAAGDIVTEEHHLPGGKPPWPRQTYRYQLDSHGNWLRRTGTTQNIAEDSDEFGPKGDMVRTITYF